jgi:hypothetical protein
MGTFDAARQATKTTHRNKRTGGKRQESTRKTKGTEKGRRD